MTSADTETRGFWLVKSEPEDWSFADQQAVASEPWDGVKNAQAQGNMRRMAKGDLVLFYHSGSERAVVGLARVARGPYPDPQAGSNGIKDTAVLVDLEAVSAARDPLSLADIKADGRFDGLALVRQPRLSVMPIDPEAFRALCDLAGIDLPEEICGDGSG